MIVGRLVSLLALALGAVGQDVASECPAPNGFFADVQQCDKYYECANNVLTEKLCPDGMAFSDINPALEKCDLLVNVDCTDRPNLQPPSPTEHCKRMNGNFAPATPNCAQAYRCVDGVGSLITCPDGLAFALETGICDWPDQTKRPDCKTKKNDTFTCPKEKMSVAVSHPRYADPNDCQYFYVCINGKTPRRSGCTFGQVFNTNTTTCTPPQDVPECADYYTEFFDEYFLSVERNPAKHNPATVAAAVAAGYAIPLQRDRVRIQPGSRRPSVSNDEPVATRARPRTPAADQSPTRLTRPSSSSAAATDRPQRRRPGASGPGGQRRRKRPRTTTTTTTTTAAPEYYDDYYYDDYYDDTLPADNSDSTAAATGTGAVVTIADNPNTAAISATRTSLPVRPPIPLSRRV